MAKSKDDVTYGAAQAELSEDETLRVRYNHGIPLEGGKIADSEPVDLFSAANRISRDQPQRDGDAPGTAQDPADSKKQKKPTASPRNG